jgi:hypothetical protein
LTTKNDLLSQIALAVFLLGVLALTFVEQFAFGH